MKHNKALALTCALSFSLTLACATESFALGLPVTPINPVLPIGKGCVQISAPNQPNWWGDILFGVPDGTDLQQATADALIECENLFPGVSNCVVPNSTELATPAPVACDWPLVDGDATSCFYVSSTCGKQGGVGISK